MQSIKMLNIYLILNKTSGQVATLPVCLIFAIVSACGLHFWPFGPQLSLRPRFRPFDTQHCMQRFLL